MDGHQEPLSLSRIKSALAGRLRSIRMEIYGEQGGPELAGQLRLPFRTWDNYENGVTIPGEVLPRFLEVTDTEALWLLHGDGPKYRRITIEVIRDSIAEGTIRSIPAPNDGIGIFPTCEQAAPAMPLTESVEFVRLT
jgi:hypothetical protein